MRPIDESSIKVAEHYATHIAEYEKIRLEQDSPVEYALTLRILKKFIKANSIVLDVGVGVGHYAEYLAKQGCQLHLADITSIFLELTETRLKQASLKHAILSSNYASATDLSMIENASVDYVLMLGPFYHLCEKQQRQQAIAEAHRILKPGGLLFASAINRVGILRELFNPARLFNNKSPYSIAEFKLSLETYLKSGNLTAKEFPPLGISHIATSSEFQQQFNPLFETIHLAGLESFSSYQQQCFLEKDTQEQNVWLDLLELTSTMADGIAMSEHFIFVGQSIYRGTE